MDLQTTGYKPVTSAFQDLDNTRLTSSELANLWASYMAGSILLCIVKYYLEHVEDSEIHHLLENTSSLSQRHLDRLKNIYSREKHPIPRGLTDEDVNPEAPRLFSDSFILNHLKDMAKIRIDGYSTAVMMATRSDVMDFFTEGLSEIVEFRNSTVRVMQSKGFYLRAPYIPVPKRVDYVKKKSFMTGYIGKRRPPTSIEISHIFSGLEKNSYRKALFTGFGQVAESEQVRKYMIRGREISEKHVEIFTRMLVENDLPVSMVWDSGVLDSKVPPFTDNLMAQSIRASNVELVASYGKAVPVVGLRHDFGVDFARLMAEAAKYAEDGVNLLIDNGWLEEPPKARNKNDQQH